LYLWLTLRTIKQQSVLVQNSYSKLGSGIEAITKLKHKIMSRLKATADYVRISLFIWNETYNYNVNIQCRV